MSKITFSGNAAGTATFTVAAPATNVDRTLTLPDESGELATTADVAVVAASVAAVESMTLLGTLTTTSGSSQSLTSLTLTSYKQLLFEFDGVSHNSGTSQSLSIGAGVFMTSIPSGEFVRGLAWLALSSGIITPILARRPLPTSPENGQIAQTGYSTATTTVTLAVSAGAFDAGSVLVYGVK